MFLMNFLTQRFFSKPLFSASILKGFEDVHLLLAVASKGEFDKAVKEGAFADAAFPPKNMFGVLRVVLYKPEPAQRLVHMPCHDVGDVVVHDATILYVIHNSRQEDLGNQLLSRNPVRRKTSQAPEDNCKGVLNVIEILSKTAEVIEICVPEAPNKKAPV
jgi:hypothetical protein